MTIKVRDYEVRLTRTKEERAMVRQLRYKVFVEEEGASATEEQQLLGEEYDSYDRFAEYMAVFHNGKVVATYRIIDRGSAEKLGGFYTETEYDIKKLKRVKGNIAEMSRACVDPEYRDSLAMRMLWMGLADYILKNKIVLIFGVASWVGTRPAEAAQAISYLYYNHLPPMSLRTTVEMDKLPAGANPKHTKMNILPKDFVDEDLAMKQMTPLVKGYLRLGAQFGKGVFLDVPFNTYDVFVLMQTKNISKAYQKHFTGQPGAFDHLGIKPGAWKTFGKILFSPVTGLMMLAEFFLKPEDAEAVERVE
ncbi:MAG: GNAT family N-acetyltransferase [Alphaproteobacteria bacterium]|nr:GNAT family N-acetyltransferase [Alphaproteobacteria bacterium]